MGLNLLTIKQGYQLIHGKLVAIVIILYVCKFLAVQRDINDFSNRQLKSPGKKYFWVLKSYIIGIEHTYNPALISASLPSIKEVRRLSACSYYLFGSVRFLTQAQFLIVYEPIVSKLLISHANSRKMINRRINRTGHVKLNSPFDSVGKIHWNLLKILAIPYKILPRLTIACDYWVFKAITLIRKEHK